MMRTGYRLRIDQVGDSILVEAIFEEDHGAMPPSPSVYWGSTPWLKYVDAPNRIERLFGTTWKKKIELAKLKVARAAEKVIELEKQQASIIAEVLS